MQDKGHFKSEFHIVYDVKNSIVFNFSSDLPLPNIQVNKIFPDIHMYVHVCIHTYIHTYLHENGRQLKRSKSMPIKCLG